MFPKPFVCGVKEQADTGVKFLSACLAIGVIDLILHFYYLQTTEFFPVVYHLPHYFLPLYALFQAMIVLSFVSSLVILQILSITFGSFSSLTLIVSYLIPCIRFYPVF